MPKLKYREWPAKPKSETLARECVAIARQYQNQGLDLTVRQLYYQLVARDRIENTLQSYKRIVNIVDEARMSGMMDWFMISDRTRHLSGRGHWTSPDEIVDAAAQGFHVDYWTTQPRRVEVWVEKEALVNVVQVAADPEDVAYFACRGYTSSSAMWRAARRFLSYWQAGQAVTILHLGDHDPSGLDMTRDIRDRLELFLSKDWVREHEHRLRADPLFADWADVLDDLERHVGERPLEIKRIALNMDQITMYNPPPNPAKDTDSRFVDYRERYGNQSWELDAIDAPVLISLIQDAIREERDDDAYNARVAYEQRELRNLGRLAGRWADVSRWLEDQEDEE